MQKWEEILSTEEMSKVEFIVGSMDINPKPSIDMFLNTIANALDAGLIKKVVL